MGFKEIIIFFLIGLLSGCSALAKQLDATWPDERTAYRQAEPLPPLEVSPELILLKPTKSF